MDRLARNLDDLSYGRRGERTLVEAGPAALLGELRASGVQMVAAPVERMTRVDADGQAPLVALHLPAGLDLLGDSDEGFDGAESPKHPR